MTRTFSKQPPPKKNAFDVYDFKNALEKQFGAQYAEFFAQTWREHAGEFLEQSSRFSKLVEWCDEEIKEAAAMINAMSPADRTDFYTVAAAKEFREHLHALAELVYYRGLLCDNRTTTAQRENIEYTIEKLYSVHYNAYLGAYV